MKRSHCLILLLAGLAALFSGCTTVHPWERATLAEYTMRPDGALQDISPTVIGILGVGQPSEMTGKDLRVKKG